MARGAGEFADAAMSERALQDAVIDLARLRGWLVYHTHDSRRSAPGFPDLVLVHPTTRRVLWRELKTMKGRLSADQSKWLDALHVAGMDASVWRPDDWRTGLIAAELSAPARRPAVDVLEDLAVALREGVHVVDFSATGFGLRHSFACRPNLLTCPVDAALRGLDVVPVTEPGTYAVSLDADGGLVVGRRLVDGADPLAERVSELFAQGGIEL